MRRLLSPLILLAFLGSGAGLAAACNIPEVQPAYPTGTPRPPTETSTPTSTPTITPSPTPEVISLWISPALPGEFQEPLASLNMVEGMPIELVPEASAAKVRAEVGAEVPISERVYAFVGAFPTLQDGITGEALLELWSGASPSTLYLTAETAAALEYSLGPPAEGTLTIVEDDAIVDLLWADRKARAIVPFDKLEPKLKVLEVDGISPLRKDFDPSGYPLHLSFGLSGEAQTIAVLQDYVVWPATNRDPNRLTVVVMTGVTALTRATAWRMQRMGVDYPGELIGDWLRDADLTHVSNEVSFFDKCPRPDPYDTSLRFCSNPNHFDLLQHLGVDLIELTGNHIKDYGVGALEDSLRMYTQAGMEYFGGGENLEDSLQPVLIEHNGNKLAFLGCNQAGPAYALATKTAAGGAPCKTERLEAEISRLRGEGYLPIFTFQWYEAYSYAPLPPQEAAFRGPIKAGAVIVNGSQAHQPMGFEFFQDGFIHHGLGNLFFDQMWSQSTREEFVDRHVFYDGRHISTELLTAMLEDWAQPRPMSDKERRAFLNVVFSASGW